MNEYPAFSIRDVRTGRTIEIFASGRVTGADEPFIVVNRIPRLIAEARAEEALRK